MFLRLSTIPPPFLLLFFCLAPSSLLCSLSIPQCMHTHAYFLMSSDVQTRTGAIGPKVIEFGLSFCSELRYPWPSVCLICPELPGHTSILYNIQMYGL